MPALPTPDDSPAGARGGLTRREAIGVLGALALPWDSVLAQGGTGPAAALPATPPPALTMPAMPDLPNFQPMLEWLARENAPQLSFLDPQWQSLDAWKSAARTVLHDALNHEWQFRFDQGGNLWRSIDPQGHVQHYRWGGQKMVYQSGPFPPTTSARDNLNNSFRRHAYNLAGDLLYSQDGSGLVDAFTYDAARNLLSEYPAQANISVQGNWVGQYGSDGHVLCGIDPGTPPTDRENLPSYVSGLTPGTAPFVRLNVTGTRPLQVMDPRAPVAADSLQRSIGAWGEASGSGFDFQVELTEAHSFNLSLYTPQLGPGLCG